MAENLIAQLVDEIRFVMPRSYPANGSLRNLRVVGHTPKTDHYVYDLVADFDHASTRLAAKVYRQSKGNGSAKQLAHNEYQTMETVYRQFVGQPLPGLARPLADFSRHAAVVIEKPSGLPLQSMIMKAALLPAYSELTHIRKAAHASGAWLRAFHDAVRLPSEPFNPSSLIGQVDDLCASCKGSGLDDTSIQQI